MRYRSTGGQVGGLSFEQALFTLYASDGGLLMPEAVPTLTPDELQAMSSLSYLELCHSIGRLFIDASEIGAAELTDVLTQAYKTVDPELQSPRIHRLTDRVSVLEMFHAPTQCFKDYAMCFTTALMNHFLKRRGSSSVSLVATSGDTGGSAVRAVESLGPASLLSLIVLFPEGRISACQRVAMTTSRCDRVRVVSVAMDSDGLDDVIRAATLDRSKGAAVCTQNSANWGRVLFQIPAYFYAYFRSARRPAQTVRLFVPTGGCGNLVAACLARRMGLPIGVCAATNQNAAAHALIGEGRFQPRPSVCTTAVAMDIAIPYNIPRLLSLFISDRGRVSELAKLFDTRAPIALTDRERADLHNLLASESASTTEVDCLAEIARVHAAFGYLACPHTACALRPALASAEAADDAAPPIVVFATAHPGKFADLYRARSLPVAAESPPPLTQPTERCDHWVGSLDECVGKLNDLLDQLPLEAK